MKAFLEEYGLVVVAAIVIGIFIVFATPFGESIKGYVDTTVSNFASQANSAVGGGAVTPTP